MISQKSRQNKKQSYISDETWQMIENRQKLHEAGKGKEATMLSKKIKRAADKDKLKYHEQELERK